MKKAITIDIVVHIDAGASLDESDRETIANNFERGAVAVGSALRAGSMLEHLRFEVGSVDIVAERTCIHCHKTKAAVIAELGYDPGNNLHDGVRPVLEATPNESVSDVWSCGCIKRASHDDLQRRVTEVKRRDAIAAKAEAGSQRNAEDKLREEIRRLQFEIEGR